MLSLLRFKSHANRYFLKVLASSTVSVQEVFPVLKENDLGCIGVFQRDKNQVKEDADIFNEWCAEYYGE